MIRYIPAEGSQVIKGDKKDIVIRKKGQNFLKFISIKNHR